MKQTYTFSLLTSLLAALFLLGPVDAGAQQIMPNDHPAGSFLMIAGSSITEDGSVLIAHNHEQPKRELFYLEKYPRSKHDSGQVIHFSNGLKIPQTKISLEWMALKDRMDYKETGVVGINEQQVAIGGWVMLNEDRNRRARTADPLVKQGVHPGVLPVILQRSRTAQEFVKILSTFFNKYGIAASFGVAVADKKEAWYVETGSGHHWAAKRIPDDACWVQTNAYRIGQINPVDSDVLASPGIKEFAAENKLYDPATQIFSFAEAFGGAIQKNRSENNFGNKRLWRAISLLDTSLNVKPDQKNYPLLVRPEDKVTMEKLISILRDQYQGTPYYIFGQDSLAQQAKPIASQKTLYSNIVQLTEGLPATIGGVLWTGLGSPNTTPYIPFYFGIKEVPKPYDATTQDIQKAYQAYKSLSDKYFYNPGEYTEVFPQLWDNFQNKSIQQQVKIDQGAMQLYRTDARMAKHFITVNVEGLSQQALDLVREQMEH